MKSFHVFDRSALPLGKGVIRCFGIFLLEVLFMIFSWNLATIQLKHPPNWLLISHGYLLIKTEFHDEKIQFNDFNHNKLNILKYIQFSICK